MLKCSTSLWSADLGNLADLNEQVGPIEDRKRFIAVLQGGFVRAGCLATASLTDASLVR